MTARLLSPAKGALLFASLCVGLIYFASTRDIVQAELAWGRGDYRQAKALSQRVLKFDPTSDRALAVAGSSSLALRDPEAAQSFLKRVTQQDSHLFGVAQRDLGRLAIHAGDVLRAEKCLRNSIAATPGDAVAWDQWIFLLMLEGRSWEAHEAVAKRLQSSIINSNYLLVFANPELGFQQAAESAQQALKIMPQESLPRLALAQQAWRDRQFTAALKQLEPVVVQHPDVVDAQILLAKLLVETGQWNEFEHACERMPSTTQTHPEIWVTRGLAAAHHEQIESAARCYWESWRLNPNGLRANYLLSQSLAALHQVESSQAFAKRAQQLSSLSLTIASQSEKLNLAALPALVNELESLGRLGEAAGWCEVALREPSRPPQWARETLARLSPILMCRSSLTVPTLDPAQHIDLSRFPLPRRVTNSPDASPAPAVPFQARISFQDDADAVGLKFQYDNGASTGDWESMIEMNGGGVAVLDYDGDHWPDVYFTQGGRLPPATFDGKATDQFFRNRGDPNAADSPLAFENVTTAAGLTDIGYGQGVTVGDFDNDGFPDLYVGNVGRNQMLHNNGDGTFSDVTAVSGTQAGGWTSSAVMADFNQDGLPDLYVVTYLGGETIFKPCNKRVRPRCSPLQYPAEPDRFYLNLGNGQFQEMAATSGLNAEEGRGLGVIAADFDGSQRLSLFVGNDMTANFFFQNRTESSKVPQFEERAMLAGLAYDHQGLAKACMGVAADDYNHDGRLDLFVTNFYRQTNDLFRQEMDGSFQDQSSSAGLAEPGFEMLGWGTQFLDADLDGNADLILTNGHVHDPMSATIPYPMPAQFFRNGGNAHFVEVPAHELGPFFERPRHGRALAKLDWNRDGRADVCISHLNEPAALLANRTDTPAHFLALRLVAVNSARDAIGTRVRVFAGNQSTTLQLTAGDGFQASNERRLTCGLGANPVVDRIEILWPSGEKQQVGPLEGDREWVLVEQRTPVAVSGFRAH